MEEAFFSNGEGTEITIELRDNASTMSFDSGAEAHFVLGGYERLSRFR